MFPSLDKLIFLFRNVKITPVSIIGQSKENSGGEKSRVQSSLIYELILIAIRIKRIASELDVYKTFR